MSTSEDPTQGSEVGEKPYEDPTRGARSAKPYEDPTQGGEVGEAVRGPNPRRRGRREAVRGPNPRRRGRREAVRGPNPRRRGRRRVKRGPDRSTLKHRRVRPPGCSSLRHIALCRRVRLSRPSVGSGIVSVHTAISSARIPVGRRDRERGSRDARSTSRSRRSTDCCSPAERNSRDARADVVRRLLGNETSTAPGWTQRSVWDRTGAAAGRGRVVRSSQMPIDKRVEIKIEAPRRIISDELACPLDSVMLRAPRPKAEAAGMKLATCSSSDAITSSADGRAVGTPGGAALSASPAIGALPLLRGTRDGGKR